MALLNATWRVPLGPRLCIPAPIRTGPRVSIPAHIGTGPRLCIPALKGSGSSSPPPQTLAWLGGGLQLCPLALSGLFCGRLAGGCLYSLEAAGGGGDTPGLAAVAGSGSPGERSAGRVQPGTKHLSPGIPRYPQAGRSSTPPHSNKFTVQICWQFMNL